jgi:glutamate-1-semialdehyde 2,1-aminomutase
MAMTSRPKSITGSGQDLYVRACRIIPGGTQLFSKRPELYLPDQWPAYYEKTKGIEVWDMDGCRYLDFASSGIGTCVLGAADPDVNAAVIKAVEAGSMSTLNCAEEVELADLLIELHPWADMARFQRTGGEAMAVAVRIARAATGRDRLAFCGYHGWFDWYVAANLADKENLNSHLLPGLAPTGVPAALAGTALPFKYNHAEELRKIVAETDGDLAAIVMEPHGVAEAPEPGFLEEVRIIADSCGAVLVFDEVTSGWRMNTGGIHMTLGVTPDIAVFAKCISNGYPMSAVIGTEAVMQAAQDSFISSAYWTERIGPAAALATIRKHRREKVSEHLIRVGNRLEEGWKIASAETGLALRYFGIAPQRGFIFGHDDADVLTTLFTQEMLVRGFIATPRVFSTLAHTDEHIDSYLNAVSDVFAELAAGLEAGDVRQRLNGPVKHSHFKRLN